MQNWIDRGNEILTEGGEGMDSDGWLLRGLELSNGEL